MRPTSLYRTCGRIIYRGGGDRYSHTYCDWLPHGHDGPCVERPTAHQLALSWFHAVAHRELPEVRSLPNLPNLPGRLGALDLLPEKKPPTGRTGQRPCPVCQHPAYPSITSPTGLRHVQGDFIDCTSVECPGCAGGFGYTDNAHTRNKQCRYENHYGYCTLSPDHDGPCAGDSLPAVGNDVERNKP